MISHKAVLASLTIRLPGKTKKDLAATDTVAAQMGADRNAGIYTKELLCRKHPSMIKLQQVVSQARSYHISKTLPWGDQGIRILPSPLLYAYNSQMRTLKSEFEQISRKIVESYDELKQMAKDRLGALYNEGDFKDPDVFARKFYFKVDIAPVATENDFRVDLEQDEVEKLREQFKESEGFRTAEAMKEAWGRLHSAVVNMATNLSDPDKIFRDSLVGNLEKIVDILPDLNISDDPDLTAMTNSVKSVLCGYTAKELRKDKELRKHVAEDASSIATRMAGYFSPPPQTNSSVGVATL